MRSTSSLQSDWSDAHTFVTFDTPFYLKAREILAWQGPNDSHLSSTKLRIGGFHADMSFFGLIGSIMARSGWKEALWNLCCQFGRRDRNWQSIFKSYSWPHSCIVFFSSNRGSFFGNLWQRTRPIPAENTSYFPREWIFLLRESNAHVFARHDRPGKKYGPHWIREVHLWGVFHRQKDGQVLVEDLDRHDNSENFDAIHENERRFDLWSRYNTQRPGSMDSNAH